MQKFKKIILLTSIYGFSLTANADSIFEKDTSEGFKRFSITAGLLSAFPLGKFNDLDLKTALQNDKEYAIGDVSTQTVLDAIDRNNSTGNSAYNSINLLKPLLPNLPSALSGTAVVSQPTSFQTSDTGLEVKDVHTLGLLLKYHYNDAISFELKGGFPPKVKAKGIGTVYAPVIGEVNLPLLSAILVGTDKVPVNTSIHISDLDSVNQVVTARAWLPALEMQYQFGKAGTDKFRPFVGVGIMYAYLNDLKLDPVIEGNLVLAGHRVQNILDDKAGAGLEGLTSSGKPVVRVKTKDAIAPMATLGFTYDFSEEWFASASVTYAKQEIVAEIDVINSVNDKKLINAKNTITVDPLISFMGIGYRF